MRNTEPDRQQIALVAAFNQDQNVLLLKRGVDVPQGGLWSFPGGKVEPGEAVLAAAERELQEECGLSGTCWVKLGEYDHYYGEHRLRFHLYRCQVSPVSRLCCESEYQWVEEGRLVTLPMPEANSALIQMLSRSCTLIHSARS